MIKVYRPDRWMVPRQRYMTPCQCSTPYLAGVGDAGCLGQCVHSVHQTDGGKSTVTGEREGRRHHAVNLCGHPVSTQHIVGQYTLLLLLQSHNWITFKGEFAWKSNYGLAIKTVAGHYLMKTVTGHYCNENCNRSLL